MPTTETPPLWRDRDAVGDRLAGAPGVVLALDFDGTLAPIVEDPDDATLGDGVEEHLDRLAAAPTVAPAIVSGRQLADLRGRVGLEGIEYAGNHGLELLVDGERTVPEAASEYRDAIETVCEDLTERLGDVSGCEIEDKGLTATVHVRRVPEAHRDGVERIVRDAVADAAAGLEVTAGKAIWEVRPPVDWDKGRAVSELVAEAPDDWLPIYVGDDVTDEDAFEALAAMDGEALAVLVGDRDDSAADYHLAGQDSVADFLAFVADRRDR